MSARARLGIRGSENGIWVGPPGVDALTAAPSQLNLEITRKTSQLIGYGKVFGSTVVPLGLSRRPFIFISSKIDYLLSNGQPLDVLVRPSNFNSEQLNVIAFMSDGSSVSISMGVNQLVAYGIYRQAFQ